MLQRFWLHEPWGPWRDNLHAAMLAIEIRRPYLKKGAKSRIGDFMIRHPDELAEEQESQRRTATRNLYHLFKSIAKRKKPHG